MLDGVKVQNAYLQLHKEGFLFLYRGLGPPLLQKSFSLAMMFGVYEEIKRPLVQVGTNQYTAKTIAALVAGTAEAVLMPFERVQALLVNRQFHSQFKNTFHAFKLIGSTHGITEYYRGLVPILLRNGPSNVGFFIIREEVMTHYPQKLSHFQKVVYDFVTGALIGATLSSLFYPLNVIKFKMQSKVGGKFENMLKVTRCIYVERGCDIKKFYLGVNLNITRAFLSWGVMSAAYELIKKFVY